jgi:3-oxoacyl-[acyl-carrier protein] reductase
MLTGNMPKYASEKVAVVTGSSKGIGKAIALEFAKEGYKIVLNARDENELSEAVNNVKRTIGANEERITYLAGDISQEDICSSLMEHTIKTFGSVDVLINNAGIRGAQKSVHELTSDEWDYVIDVNLKGAFCVHEKQ